MQQQTIVRGQVASVGHNARVIVYVQVAFVGHDAGHNAVAHVSKYDGYIGLLVNACIGIGPSWWKVTYLPTLPCSALPCPALPCPALPCMAQPYPALRRTALPCTALQCYSLAICTQGLVWELSLHSGTGWAIACVCAQGLGSRS